MAAAGRWYVAPLLLWRTARLRISRPGKTTLRALLSMGRKELMAHPRMSIGPTREMAPFARARRTLRHLVSPGWSFRAGRQPTRLPFRSTPGVRAYEGRSWTERRSASTWQRVPSYFDELYAARIGAGATTTSTSPVATSYTSPDISQAPGNPGIARSAATSPATAARGSVTAFALRSPSRI